MTTHPIASGTYRMLIDTRPGHKLPSSLEISHVAVERVLHGTFDVDLFADTRYVNVPETERVPAKSFHFVKRYDGFRSGFAD